MEKWNFDVDGMARESNSAVRIIIIHGTKGSPQGNWFPWVALELKNSGHEIIVPTFPTPDDQTLSTWKDVFYRQCGALTVDTILIGHSIGAVFALRLLEESQVQIAATFLVAGLTGRIGIDEYDDLNRTFLVKEFQWEKIKLKSSDIFCLIGSNDPYVPTEQPLSMARLLGIVPKIIKGGGHLNAESGYVTFPLLLVLLDEVLNPATKITRF